MQMSYKYKHFQYIRGLDQFGVDGPYYRINLYSSIVNYEGCINAYGAYVAAWLHYNLPDADVWISGDRTLYFSDRSWVEKLQKELKEGQPHKKIEHQSNYLWPTKESFHQALENNGSVHICGSIGYDLKNYDYSDDRGKEPTITKEAFEVFLWMFYYCRGGIWRWDGKFYFEKESDLMAFKIQFTEPKKSAN